MDADFVSSSDPVFSHPFIPGHYDAFFDCLLLADSSGTFIYLDKKKAKLDEWRSDCGFDLLLL